MSIWLPPGFDMPTVPEEDRYEGTELDANVTEALPKGAVVKCVKTNPFCSFWAINSKVIIRLRDGSEKSLFLKFYTVPGADDIAQAEFEGSQTLSRALPDNATRPVAWGRCASRPGWAFFLAEFRDMTPMRPGLPAPAEVAAVVARLHGHRSPCGRFGFHVGTFAATQVIDTSWCDTWEAFFARNLAAVLAAELAAQGPDPELEALSAVLLGRVVPRLIRPLETGGNKIEPVLLHGDLWHGNIAVDTDTENVLLYDPCCFYGHRDYSRPTGGGRSGKIRPLDSLCDQVILARLDAMEGSQGDETRRHRIDAVSYSQVRRCILWGGARLRGQVDGVCDNKGNRVLQS
ncbi:hypothetical protein RB598_004411 [Gaeumannomyces tritici]